MAIENISTDFTTRASGSIAANGSAANGAIANGAAPVEATPAKRSSKWHRLEVREAVPRHLAELGEISTWRAMVRQLAFEKMYHHVSTKQAFTVRCKLKEEWEANPLGSGQRLVITCELKYSIDSENP